MINSGNTAVHSVFLACSRKAESAITLRMSACPYVCTPPKSCNTTNGMLAPRGKAELRWRPLK